MATEDNFIVAIELGSSKVTGIAGRKQPDGAIQILAFAQEPSDSFIRKGRINNVNKMTQCVSSMKENLEKKLKKTVSRVYVGIGGMGMHTVANTVTRHFHEKTVVTQDMVDSICEANRTAATPDKDILEVVPQEFKLGTQQQTDPVGIPTEKIEGRYLNIIAGTSLREDIANCFRNAGITIADLPITVLALADTMLTEPEKRSGCVFVDMGSETTSVAVFKNNLLRHLAVIPLGGANINRDITSLQIEDDEAEELKLTYGSALAESTEEEKAPITLHDGRTIRYEEFSGLVEARMEEIILNIANQIALSKYDKNQLIGGIVITGGAANMKNTEKAFREHTKFEKLRFVKSTRLPLRTNLPDFNKDGSCNAAIALIDKGELNCCGGPLGSPTPNMFPTEEEVREKERKAAEAAEAAKRQKEEEERRAAQAKAEAEAEAERRRIEQEKAEQKARRKQRWDKFKRWASRFVSDEDDNIMPPSGENTGK